LVIVPTFNEAENIEPFLRAVRRYAPAAHVLVADDNSPDGTADVAEAVASEVGHVKVLRRPSKDGLGAAYRASFHVGLDEGYEALVQIDADLSHDPAVLPRLLDALERGADLAIGSRYVPGGSTPNWPLHRRVLSRSANHFATTVLRLPIRDATSGFRAYTAASLRAIDYDTTESSGYAFLTELAYRITAWGGTVEEIPIAFVDRSRGTSKMSSRIIAESMVRVTRWGIGLQARRFRQWLSGRTR